MHKGNKRLSMIIRTVSLVAIAALLLPIAACGVLENLGIGADADASAQPAAERMIAVNTASVTPGSIRTELSFTGQVRASSQIAVMSRVQGTVDEVMVNVGDFVNEGDVLFTMDEVDLQTNIRALTAQLETAEAAVNAANTGVALAGGSAVQGQVLQAQTAIMQAEAGVTQAEAAVVHAQAAVTQAEAGVEQAEMGVEQRALAVRQAEIAHDDAGANLENMAILLEFGDISQVQFDQAQSGASNAAIMLEQARSAYEMARVSLAQAQSGVETARNGVQTAQNGVQTARNGVAQANASYRLITQDVRSESLQRAQDGLAQAQAQRDALAVNLDAATERLDDASITAPISGIISSRGVEPRAMMLPNVAPFTIVSVDEVLVHVNVTETIVNRIENGQSVAVNISAASSTPFIGQVVTVSPTADPMTQTFSVEISIDNSEGLLRPGMFAEAFFVRDEAENTIVVPRGAVLLDDGSPIVFVVEGQQAIRREVTLGIDSGAKIEITGGLELGDQLIVTGQTFVRDGSPIVIVENGGEAS